MKTAEAAKGHWPVIFEHYGLPPVTGKNHFKGECPSCGGRGKYRCDDHEGNGTWICTCGSGDGMALLLKTQGKPFGVLCREIDHLLGNDYQHRVVPINTTASSLRQRVISKFSKLSELRGTSAANYLFNRGVTRLPSDAVRFCDKERHNGRIYQSIFSLATDNKTEMLS